MKAEALSKYLLMEAYAEQRINCWLDASQGTDTQWNSETGSLTSGWAYGIHHPSSRQTLGCSKGLALLWLEGCPYATGDESPSDLIICGSEAQVPGSRVGAGGTEPE